MHRVAREHAAATEQATGLPVRQSEFGLEQRELSVDPTREPVADEGRLDGSVEPLVLLGVAIPLAFV